VSVLTALSSGAVQGPGAEPTVSVVVCTYTHDRWSELCDALASLERQGRPPAEVIVVTDHNRSLFERVRAAWPLVTVIENGGPRGLSGARNTGVAAASGDIVAFIDDDAIAESDWLERLVDPYASEDVIGVGGSVQPHWVDEPPQALPEEFYWVVGCSYRGLPETRAAVRNFIGANMSYRRAIFEAVGGFRTSLGRVGGVPLGCEETEFGVRAKATCPDSTLVYEPEARVRHQVPAARTTWSYFRARCYSEGLSKAEVVRLAGASAGLQSERNYTFRTLPGALARELAALGRGERAAALNAAALAVGVAWTGAGYVVGRTRIRLNTTSGRTTARRPSQLRVRPA
jgi:GT2 family glycosyltransferase